MDSIKSTLDAVRAVCEAADGPGSEYYDISFSQQERTLLALTRTAVPALLDAVERIDSVTLGFRLAGLHSEATAIEQILLDALDGLEVDHE
jgi:hypothetical protein